MLYSYVSLMEGNNANMPLQLQFPEGKSQASLKCRRGANRRVCSSSQCLPQAAWFPNASTDVETQQQKHKDKTKVRRLKIDPTHTEKQ